MFTAWVADTLEIYKVEIKRLEWPVFVYSYLNMVKDHFPHLAKEFFNNNKTSFTQERAEDIRMLENVSNEEHIEQNSTASAYWKNKYRLTLTGASVNTLLALLESKDREGGSVILHILSNHVHINSVDRAAAGSERFFASMLARAASGDADVPDEDEGIPGHNAGSANLDPKAPPVLTRLALGPLPMDTDAQDEVRDELEDEDEKHPPHVGEQSYSDLFDHRIKREPSEDAPNRDAVPLPKPKARDIEMEVRKIKEIRNRFKIEPRSGGIGPGISVCMFTFHNTQDCITSMDFSGDNLLVAAGTSESYIRVWSLDGKPLPSLRPNEDGVNQPTSSKRLIGHSGPVYAVSFSPSIGSNGRDGISTTTRYLLSASEDKSVRMWSMDSWSQLVVYKGHDFPVWDITWGPFGHYFLTGSRDTTARLWSTDTIAPLRVFVGHDNDVDCVAFHPNNAYVFTGSSDKTVRMWDVARGSAVRLFTGHTANITALSCSPSGKSLASADESGSIILWDLATGRRIKRMRGHGRGGIWSLSWSIESTQMVSCGADNTVRVWDVLMQSDGSSGSKSAGDSNKPDGTSVSAAAGPQSVVKQQKAKAKDATVTPDQVSAFPTKRSPVYKVRFTNMNLVLAGGAYLP